jgi:hypothetical protein
MTWKTELVKSAWFARCGENVSWNFEGASPFLLNVFAIRFAGIKSG